MVKAVVHDPIFLAEKSEVATKEDLQAAQDLLDTLIANKDGCVGMAANMIGVRKRIIVFDNEGTYLTMFNPEIIKNLDHMTPRKVVFLCSEVPAPANASKPSKFNGKPLIFKLASTHLAAGLRRLSNMRLIIAMGF